MVGNRATGSPAMLTAPMTTSRMEMTIATIGRRMKNFDIALLARRFGRVCFRGHRHAGANLLNALGNNAFAGLQSFVNDPLGSNPIAGPYISNADLISAVDDGDLVS